MEEPPMPDLSHLSAEEREIIEQVLQRQKAEEDQAKNISQKADKELDDIDKQINERKDAAMRLIGTQDDAICQICQKTKFADGIGHKCYYCQLRSCARCGGRTTIKLKTEPKQGQAKQQNKNIWACSLCQKRQQILAKTGKWFNQPGGESATTPTGNQPQQFGGPMGPPMQGHHQQQQPHPPQHHMNQGSRPPSQTGVNQPYGPGGPQYGPGHGSGPPGQAQPSRGPPTGPGQQPHPQTNAQPLPSAQPHPGPAQNQNHMPHPPPGGHQPQSGPSRQQSLQRQSSLEQRRQNEDTRYQNGPPHVGARRTPPENYRSHEDHRGGPPVNGEDRRLRDRERDRERESRRGGQPSQNLPRHGPPHAPTDNRLPPNEEYDRHRMPPQQQGPSGAYDSRNQSQYDQQLRDQDRYGPSGYNQQQVGLGTTNNEWDRQPHHPMDDRSIRPEDRDYDSRRSGLPPSTGPRDERRQQYTSPPNDDRRREMDQQRRYDEDYGPGRRTPPRGAESRGLDQKTGPTPRHPDDRHYATDPHARRNDSNYRGDPRDRERERERERDRRPPEEYRPSRDSSMPGDPSRRTPPMRQDDVDRRDRATFRNGPPRSPPALSGQGAHVGQGGPPRRKDVFHPGASTIGPALPARTKLDTTWRTDSLSSEDQIRAHKQQGLAGKTHHHHVRHKKPSKLPKRHSLSSSDEEFPSTSECPSCDDRDLESEGFSEKGLLRYLYGSQRHKNCVAKYPGDSLHKKAALNGQLVAGGQLPVTWQPSADRTRLIGHMILHRHSAGSSGDLGFKVVGGRRTETGRLGAFITRVKKGSAADIIGHLKPGDEVLEWNGRQLQNASFEQVYQIISFSKDDPQVELIVSRPAGPAAELYTDPANDLLPRMDAMAIQQQPMGPPLGIPSGMSAAALPGASGALPMVSMPGDILPPGSFSPNQAPVLMVTGPQEQAAAMAAGFPGISFSMQEMGVMPGMPLMQKARGQIFGRIEMALYYTTGDCQLVVTVNQAMDLPPRADGTPRNPYVKMFLLPDRSERSRRQSKVLVGTCVPTWKQPFIYQNLNQQELVNRVLEVTLWDYDKFATNDFLGEVLIDLSVIPMNNEPRWFTLTDMDEDSPLRMRVRQQRLSAYLGGPPDQMIASPGQPMMARSPMGPYSQGPYPFFSGNSGLGDAGRRFSSSSGYRSDSGLIERSYPPPQPGMPRSHTYHRPRHPQAVRQEDDMFGELYSAGYYSDHGYSSRGGSGHHRRPRSATGIRPSMRDLRPSSPTERGGPMFSESGRHLPQVPGDLYGEEALQELDEKAQRLRSQQYSTRGIPHQYNRRVGPRGQQPHRSRQPRALPQDPNSPPTDSNVPPGVSGGYGSDCSETSMSVTSTQSERPRGRNTQEYQNSLDPAPDEMMEMMEQDGTMSDSAVGAMGSGGATSARAKQQQEEKRKKSLMTRLIPGRQNQQNASDAKRTGFNRSEEVGVPNTLSPQSSLEIVRQASKESTDSDNWFPIHPEGPLGEFVSDLGPGQVVGRQVLASPCLGEIQIGLVDKRGTLEIEIVRARNLVIKPAGKNAPAPYVKVYLMDGKVCCAKAKTNISRKTTEPLFQQQLQFTEPYQNRMLQITVWGDFGQMKRKTFMGIAQIRLDKLNLGAPVIGWYKLFHSNSLIGTGSPARKDSQNSLPENQVNAVNQ